MACLGWLSICLGCLAGVSVQAQKAVPFYGSEAFRDLRLAGYEVIKESEVDLNHDGLNDAVVVEQSDRGIGFSAWLFSADKGYRMVFRSEPVPASSLENILLLTLGKSNQAWLLDAYEDSPDEEEHWVKLFLAEQHGVREIFTSSYQRIHSEEDAGRSPVHIMDLGGMEAGLKIEPVMGSWPRLLVRNAPKKIVHRTEDLKPVWIVIGMQEQIFEAKQGRYQRMKDHYLDFLPSLRPVEIAKRLKKTVGAEEKTLSTTLSDQNFSTGWVIKNPAEGKTLSMTFSSPEQIRMIRVVPFCEDQLEGLKKPSQLLGFEILLEKQPPIHVSRKKKTRLDTRIEVVDDFALPGSEIGVQTLVFLSNPIRARSLKLIVREVEQLEDVVSPACVSEISVHRAVIDYRH